MISNNKNKWIICVDYANSMSWHERVLLKQKNTFSVRTYESKLGSDRS